MIFLKEDKVKIFVTFKSGKKWENLGKIEFNRVSLTPAVRMGEEF